MYFIMNLCAVCRKESKYKCPACLLLTCSLECTKSHNCSTSKGENSSNRKPNRRNPVKYVGRNKIDVDVITSDCHFLDTVSNRLESTSRSFLKPLITDSRNRKIKKLCVGRKINLIYSPLILKRYKTNKTTHKNSRILWTVEWSFLKQQLNFIDHKSVNYVFTHTHICSDSYLYKHLFNCLYFT
ncbi:Box C/D snoRNA protein [Theileria orientalis strain Shintoku]|uniref:Box C/D snoRNA protein n=1 Tax=Theileria orientalis strain Shintoku TaxID=869250 RepID=J4C8T3_THEOR|nr:Box C/D snoRNA protein [Theileria orientalis strain Shintoku]BAM41338.1 Box C/D snoRNA protein [Theileria orientalis strain Shintoku]|eukprot:XP_009691639.1 Box C/D snoRNA protein [Theileria orientalis strain Shintoku]